MRVETAALAGPFVRNEAPPAAEAIDMRRREPEVNDSQPVLKKDKAVSEEVLTKIKELTQDGMYSVQFEMNKEAGALVIKVVAQNGQVIRQIPPEELLDLSRRMSDFRGLIVNTER